MNIKKILWGLVILCILLSIPPIIERINVERANDTYEITIPYVQIEEMINIGLDKDFVLGNLSSSGLQSVGFEPLTVRDLENKGIVKTVSKSDLLQHIGSENAHVLPETTSQYLEILIKDHRLVKNIEEVFNLELIKYGFSVEALEIEDRLFYIFPSLRTLNKFVGFDLDALDDLTAHGIKVVPRLSNDFDFDVNHPLMAEFLYIVQTTGANKVLFQSDEVTGFPRSPGEPSFLPEMAEILESRGLSVLQIEDYGQKGLSNLGSMLDHNVIRLHSMTLGKGQETNNSHVNRAIRALNERNIRTLYVNTLRRGPEFYNDVREAETSLYGTMEFVENTQKASSLHLGISSPFQPLTQPIWLKIVVLIGSVALFGLFAQALHRQLLIPAVVMLGLVVLLQIVTGHTLLLKLITLGMAVVAPIFAVISIKRFDNIKGLFLQFLKAFGIALTGAWIVVGLLYGTEFLIKLDMFTGVKVLAGLPLLLALILLLKDRLITILKSGLKVWHLLIIGLFGVVFVFYITRTGNQGVLLPFEAEIRQLLESGLGVRPRTTEFLIGYPLFFLGMYLTMIGKKWGRVLYVFGALAFSSMVGTFTHLHTELMTSVARTFLGVFLGLLVGIMIIIGYHLLKKLYPVIKERLEL